MARLGAVLGSLLAELARARAVSDQLTRELLEEYEADPVLGSLGVPRITIGEAEVVVRYAVDTFDEEAPETATAAETRDAWQEHAERDVIPKILKSRGLTNEDAAAVVARLTEEVPSVAGRARVSEIRSALAGDSSAATVSTSQPILDNWTKMPRSTRTTLGTKTAFRNDLNSALETELKKFLDRRLTSERLQAALASKIDVSVGRGELAKEDPEMIQELRLTITSDDLDIVLDSSGEDGTT